MTNYLTEKVRVALNALAQQENELIAAALTNHTGVVNPNPYDYINRMSSRILADGYVVLLDRVEILWIGRPTYVTEGDTTKFSVQYRHILPQRKENEQLH